MNQQNDSYLLILPLALTALWLRNQFSSLKPIEATLLSLIGICLGAIALIWIIIHFSPWEKERRKRLETLRELPGELLMKGSESVLMGIDTDLQAQVYLPDHIRTRHVHILGATGSGKTESVILNFLRQDIQRGLGSIILDAKGDHSFIEELGRLVPKYRLQVFDLSSDQSLGYNPLDAGSALESAQRLFSSLTWSEEYYKSKALSALQRIFQIHFEVSGKNPTLLEIADYLETPKRYSGFVSTEDFPENLALAEFQDLSGLRDQVRSLTMGHLAKSLSPKVSEIDPSKATAGFVIYFRLQSLMSPQIVSIIGKLLINHLNFLAGTAHRGQVGEKAKQRKLVPVYVDEFASFACSEFADLISKARSAGFALHFSHQSIGDVTEVSPGFLNRITDNSATKIVMRINDPDSAEFLARCFGTKEIQKTTQRITNTKDLDSAEIVGEGTTRDAHRFRASPDLLKSLPTGTGSVLVSHGFDSPHGATSVFKVAFPAISKARGT